MLASLGPLLPLLATATGMTPDRIAQILTVVMGGAAIGTILKGIRQHDKGDHESGALNVGAANALFFLTALLGECVRLGHPGIYTLAEVPFLLAAMKDLRDRLPVLQNISGLLQHYRAEHALALNAVIHGSLVLTGNIASLPEALTAAGFTAMSTAFAMDVSDAKRNPLVYAGTAVLFLGSLLQTLPTLPEFLRTGDINTLAVVPAIWTVLNGILLVGQTSREAVEHLLTALGDPDPHGTVQPQNLDRIVSPFQMLMH